MKPFSEQVHLTVYEKAKESADYTGGGWVRGIFGKAEFLQPIKEGIYEIEINGIKRKIPRDIFGLFCTLSAYVSLTCNPKYEKIKCKIPILEQALVSYLDAGKIDKVSMSLNQFNA